MENPSEKKYPVNAKDYNLHEEVGEGVSATVYKALCIPLNEIVAIKVLDLEKCNNDLVCLSISCIFPFINCTFLNLFLSFQIRFALLHKS